MGSRPQARASSSAERVLPDLARLRILFVNVYFVGTPASWVLLDAGLRGTAGRIRRAAEAWFGEGTRPEAILLTHGHFDHIGALPELAAHWDVPVYAHRLEFPYLTGRSDYPPPDPSVGGGAMALLSWMYPRGPIDVGERIEALPTDGTVPHLPGWRWMHTPGHTPGHVSLFREADRTLLAGDAFVTVKQESLSAVLMQRRELHGPPAYFTPDWQASRRSVERLAVLEPDLAATGHGIPMRGEALASALHHLAQHFDRIAVPPQGRYVRQPAVMDEYGVIAVPPPAASGRPWMLIGLGLAVLGGAVAIALQRRSHT